MTMANPVFHVDSYTISGQHLREYPGALLNEEEGTVIKIKRYTSTRNQPSQNGDVTIIAAGGMGFVKELYEPLFEDLETRQSEYRIRSIWIADMNCLGASALANQQNLGHDPNWFDHSRDLLLMINCFRKEMPRPIIGLGHSMGCAQICHLSLMHPSLFTSLILVEPSIYQNLHVPTFLMACRAVARRREVLPSRRVAQDLIKKNPFYQRWDPRVLDRLMAYHFCNTLKKEASPSHCTSKDMISITTPKHMELALMARSNFAGHGKHGLDDLTASDRADVPDVDPDVPAICPIYRPEPNLIYRQLENIRPPVLYVVGDKSPAAPPEVRAERLRRTGKGIGGSGGVTVGMVKEVLVPRGQHTIPLDKNLPDVVNAIVPWLSDHIKTWTERNEAFRTKWKNMTTEDKQTINESLYLTYKNWDGTKSFDEALKANL